MSELSPLQVVIMASLALIGGLAMGFLHYALPAIIGREVGAPWTYIIGVAFGILAPFTAWVLIYGNPVDLLALYVIVALAGLFTLIGHYYDRQVRERERREAILRKMEKLERMNNGHTE